MHTTLIEKLQKQFHLDEITHVHPGLIFMTGEKEQCVSLLHALKTEHGFRHLILITAVDYLEQGKFQLTYLLNNPETRTDTGIRIYISRDHEGMYPVHGLWPTAATYQRELKEMFGIDFPGSPGVDEPFILEGWHEIPPYRRDFDTRKFADQFYHQRGGRTSNDPARFMKEKMYPDE